MSDESKHMQPAQCSRVAMAACRDSAINAVASTRPTKRNEQYYACTTVRPAVKRELAAVNLALKQTDRFQSADVRVEVSGNSVLVWWKR